MIAVNGIVALGRSGTPDPWSNPRFGSLVAPGARSTDCNCRRRRAGLAGCRGVGAPAETGFLRGLRGGLALAHGRRIQPGGAPVLPSVEHTAWHQRRRLDPENTRDVPAGREVHRLGPAAGRL